MTITLFHLYYTYERKEKIMENIMLLVGMLVFVLLILIVLIVSRHNYNLRVNKCKKCINFGFEKSNIRKIYCKKHGWMTPKKMSKCKDFNMNDYYVYVKSKDTLSQK